MTNNKQCPLCGRLVDDEDSFCEECRNHVDNQYRTDLLAKDDSEEQVDQIVDKDEVYSEDETEVKESVDSQIEVVEESISKPKKLSKSSIYLLIGCILLLIGGGFYGVKVFEKRKAIEKEDLYWNQCITENTPEGYAKYLLTFQNGRYVDDANARIREIRNAEDEAWDNLRKSSDINDFYAYLGKNPNTPHIRQIKFLMDSLTWVVTIQQNTTEAYTAYLENVKLGNLSGNYVDIAQDKYTYLSQIKTLEGASLDSLKVEVDNLFTTLSENNPKLLLKLFASEVAYNKPDSIISSTVAVSEIEQERKKLGIRELTYLPQEETLIGKVDNNNVLFLNILVDRKIVYDTKIKVGKKTEYKQELLTDTFNIELNKNKQIQSILVKSKKATNK